LNNNTFASLFAAFPTNHPTLKRWAMERNPAKLATYKRIILCSDGTWLESDQGDKTVPSNVAKIARALAPNGLDANNNVVKQIVSYQSGLGSGNLPFQKAIAGQ
jgi:uncharacterized protein (DUF2235 family)